MNFRQGSSGLAAGILTLGLLAFGSGVFAQDATQAASPPPANPPVKSCCANYDELQKLYFSMPPAKTSTPRAADGHPDLSGFWDNEFQATAQTKANGSVDFELAIRHSPFEWPAPNEPSYKPEYLEKVKKILESMYGNASAQDPQFDCKPMGVPRATDPPMQIVQSPKVTAILYESNVIGETYRVIYTDGRPHPKDLDTSYLGDSIGHWEGDTLVVDVTGLNDETWLGSAGGHLEPGGPGETGGHVVVEKYAVLHSDQEHVIERYTRRGNLLIYQATVEDPVALAKPWVLSPRYMMLAARDDRIYESTCEVKDKSHIIQPTQDDKYIPGQR